MGFKVLITDPIAKEGVNLLRDAGFQVDERPDLKGEKLVAEIHEYDALIVRSATKVTREVIEAASRLKVIGRAGVGLDNIDLVAAKEHGIEVINTPGATAISVAELALGLMLACARRIPQADRSVHAGRWEKKLFKGIELYGKTLGIIGIGKIGTELARRAAALGMKVIAYDPFVKSHEIAEMVDFDELLSRADVISLHLPLTDETRNMLSENEFAKMKDGVILVNAARGGIVDEDALAKALESGKVRCAALDVYAQEPIDPDSPLLKFENIVLTPHIGAQTLEGQRRAGIEIAQKIRNFLIEKGENA